MTFPPITPAVGTKFDAAGAALPFPGSSVVCAVPRDTALYDAARRIQQAGREVAPEGGFALLPSASFHMTVFDLLCHRVRASAHWSRLLPLDAPLEQTDRLLAQALSPLSWPEPPRMRLGGLGPLGGDNTLHLRLEPADEETAATLQAFREAISAAAGIRHPGHQAYFYHVSLAYPLRELTAAEREAIADIAAAAEAQLRDSPVISTLGRPYLTLFEDMLGFPTQRPVR